MALSSCDDLWVLGVLFMHGSCQRTLPAPSFLNSFLLSFPLLSFSPSPFVHLLTVCTHHAQLLLLHLSLFVSVPPSLPTFRSLISRQFFFRFHFSYSRSFLCDAPLPLAASARAGSGVKRGGGARLRERRPLPIPTFDEFVGLHLLLQAAVEADPSILALLHGARRSFGWNVLGNLIDMVPALSLPCSHCGGMF